MNRTEEKAARLATELNINYASINISSLREYRHTDADHASNIFRSA